jgi:hypothetical protein
VVTSGNGVGINRFTPVAFDSQLPHLTACLRD